MRTPALNSRQFNVLTCTAILTIAFAAVLQAGLVVNGGFESGNLNGWDTMVLPGASVSVVASHADSFGTGTTSWGPSEGSYFSLLTAYGYGVPTELSQTFTVNQGDVLKFDYFWDSQDDVGFNDMAFGLILSEAVLFTESVDRDPDIYWGTQWTTVSHTFASSGTYTLRFTINNGNDTGFTSYLGVDNVEIIPEPASMALLALGGLLIRRKQRA